MHVGQSTPFCQTAFQSRYRRDPSYSPKAQVIERLANGEAVAAIAKALGTSRQSIMRVREAT